MWVGYKNTHYFLDSYSHIGHYRALNRVPWAIPLSSYLFYILYCTYVNPDFTIYPSPASLP